MMDKEQRRKYLELLSKSHEGEALKEHIEILISQLTDARNYKSEDFELEGKASLKAAGILQRLLSDLLVLGKSKKDKIHNQYK